MHRMADFMRVPNMAALAGYEHGTPGILMIPGVVARTMVRLGWTKVARESLALDPWPITASPDNYVLMVAGGGHPTNSYWLQGHSPGVAGRAIEVPAGFEGLLAEAERDLEGR
jgi:hypothetical protein